MEILRLDGLCKQYPAFRLENVSFSMEAGTIMGLIGRNGAGKTTTLKSMLHLVHPDEGRITICGLDMDRDEREIRSRIGFVSGSAIRLLPETPPLPRSGCFAPPFRRQKHFVIAEGLDRIKIGHFHFSAVSNIA